MYQNKEENIGENPIKFHPPPFAQKASVFFFFVLIYSPHKCWTASRFSEGEISKGIWRRSPPLGKRWL